MNYLRICRQPKDNPRSQTPWGTTVPIFSTVTNVLSAYNVVANYLDRKHSVDIIYFDFQKAFDKLSHVLIIDKLKSLLFPLYLVRIIKNFLCNRHQLVVLNGVLSSPKPVTSGVPQGTILAPILFSLFLNDIFSLPLASNLYAYADDIKMIGQVSSTQDLSKDITLLNQWCVRNCMVVNCEKSGIVHFGSNNPESTYMFDGKPIPVLSIYKDLGIFVDSRLAFDVHTTNLAKKTRGLIWLLLKSISKKNKKFAVRMYKQYVLPSIFYATPFFFPRYIKDIDILERIQKSFVRALLPQKALHYETRLALLDLVPIEATLIRRGLLYIYKILTQQPELRSLLPPFVHTNSRSSKWNFVIPIAHSEIRKNMFPNYLIPIWNALPQSIFDSSSLSSFRQSLSTFDLSAFLKGRALKMPCASCVRP